MFISSVSTPDGGSIAPGASSAYTLVNAFSAGASGEATPSLVAFDTSSFTRSSNSVTSREVRTPSSSSRFLNRSRQSFLASWSISSCVR